MRLFGAIGIQVEYSANAGAVTFNQAQTIKELAKRWGLSEVLIYEIIEGFSLYNPLIEALISYVEYYPNLIVG